MKKRPTIKLTTAVKEVFGTSVKAPVLSESRPGNFDQRLQGISNKTSLVPRLVCPRWSGYVDEFGGKFVGDLSLGNGTKIRVGCFFDHNRHFAFCIFGHSSWLFPAGQTTNWQAVKECLSLGADSDAKCLSDFINSQLDDGLDENDHVGEYQRAYCG